jgi:hypothetical protein
MARSRRLNLEQLEDRSLPSTFGIPWHDAKHLTLSFAPDNTPIASHQSDLFRALNSLGTPDVWQREILRAMQTWAVQGNINVGVTADGGQPFGIAGRTQGDPRFGDIRVGAHVMSPEVLSISVPQDPALSGTLSGDVFLNSSFSFDNTTLFPIMLHEAGHVFGLDESRDPDSPMFSQFNRRTELTRGDINNLQALYGARASDGRFNHSFNTAASIQYPRDAGVYDKTTPVIVFGDVTTLGEQDYFSLRPPEGYNGPVTFRLQTAGLSLLAPRLTIYDANQRVLGQAQSTNAAGDVVSVHLDRVDPRATYYAKVEGATRDVFGIGSYGLAVTFDANLTVSPDAIDAALRGPYETLKGDDVDRIFRDSSSTFFNDDGGADDTFLTAVALRTTPGYAPQTHYEAIASLTDPADVDFYRITTASVRPGEANVLTVTLTPMPVNGVNAKVFVYDNSFNPVAADVLVNGNDTYTIQIANAPSGVHYFLKVVAADPAGQNVGNYSLIVNSSHLTANLQTLGTATLDDSHNQDTHTLYIARSQLFQFNLSADAMGAPTDADVRMTIYDSNGNAVFSLVARAGDTVSGNSVFLAPGAYTVNFTAESPSGSSIPALIYRLRGTEISDPIGTGLADVTLTPMYTCPDDPGLYCYPGNITSPNPFLFF